jgi:predicted acetyltransferase
MAKFIFKKYPVFTDGEIDVVVDVEYPAKRSKGLSWPPTYYFKIMRHGCIERIGRISLSIGYNDFVVKYNGQCGFSIKKEFRGHRYAAKACMLIKQVAIDHHMDVVWIACNPDNISSRRTCEIIGCTLVEIVDVPRDSFLYKEGNHHSCRYRWILY